MHTPRPARCSSEPQSPTGQRCCSRGSGRRRLFTGPRVWTARPACTGHSAAVCRDRPEGGAVQNSQRAEGTSCPQRRPVGETGRQTSHLEEAKEGDSCSVKCGRQVAKQSRKPTRQCKRCHKGTNGMTAALPCVYRGRCSPAVRLLWCDCPAIITINTVRISHQLSPKTPSVVVHP